MSWDGFFFPDTVRVRDFRPGGSLGGGYAEPRSLSSETIDVQEIVRNASGQEVVSSTRVTVPIESSVPLGSLVTVWPGTVQEREAEVLRVGHDKNPPPLPSHQILWLK